MSDTTPGQPDKKVEKLEPASRDSKQLMIGMLKYDANESVRDIVRKSDPNGDYFIERSEIIN